MKLTHFYRTIPWSYDRQGNGAGRQVLWLENQKTSGGQRVSQTGNVRRDEHHSLRLHSTSKEPCGFFCALFEP